MDNDDVDLLFSRCLDNLEPEERAKFKDAVHLTPTWAETYRVMAHHLTNTLTGPIAKIHARLTSCHASNYLIKENSLPVYNTLCAGGKVMLLTNYTVTLFIARPLVRTIGRCFLLASDGAKCLHTHPQVYHFAYNKERTLYNSNWFYLNFSMLY